MTDNIVIVFGQYAVKLAKGVVLFDTHEAAAIALFAFTKKDEIGTRARAYTDASGFEGKMAVAKQNVIESFLAWEAAAELDEEAELESEGVVGRETEEFETEV